MNSKVENAISLFQEQKINEAEIIALEVLEIDIFVECLCPN